MALTNSSRGFKLTAAGDERPGLMSLISLRVSGSGLTPGGTLTLVDSDGGLIVEYVIGAASENAQLIQGEPWWVKGVKIGAVPAGGGTIGVTGIFQ